jgi:hypothetical protein
MKKGTASVSAEELRCSLEAESSDAFHADLSHSA